MKETVLDAPGRLRVADAPAPTAGPGERSDVPESAGLRVEVLGAVRAWVGMEEVALGQPLQVAVFAALALNAPHAVSMSGLVDALWGENHPARAEGSVYTYISGIRRALGRAGAPGVLERSAAGYALRLETEEVDAGLVERDGAMARRLAAGGDAEAAVVLMGACLARWDGTALRGCPGPFAESQRVRLGAARLGLIEERAQLLLGLGRDRDVVAELPGTVKAEPFCEGLRATLMTALYRCGRQAEALAQFAELRTVLSREIGIDPSPPLRRLHEQILRADPTLLAVPPAVGRQAVAQLPHEVSNFVGRVRELDLLADWCRETESTVPAVLISAIDGAGGVGKTALAVRFAHQGGKALLSGCGHANSACSPHRLAAAVVLVAGGEVADAPVQPLLWGCLGMTGRESLIS